MNQVVGAPFLVEEIEFVHNEQSLIYSFRVRDSRITLKQVPSDGGLQEQEVDVFPDASIAAVNTAVLVLFNAAMVGPEISKQDFLPTTLRKLLTHYSSRDRLQFNMRKGAKGFGGGKFENTPVEDIVKFLEPYTPWATPSSLATPPSRPPQIERPVPSPQAVRQSIHDVLDLPTKSDQLSGLRETFGLPSSNVAQSPLKAVNSRQSPQRMINVTIPKISLSTLIETSQTESAQPSSAQPASPSQAQQTPPKNIPVGFEQPSVPVTPQSRSRINDKQQNGRTLTTHKNTPSSAPPAKNPLLLPPTPAPTPSPTVPGAGPPTTSNLKRQHCQDPFEFHSGDEDEGVVLVNVPRKRRQIVQNEGSGEEDNSQNGSISTVATSPTHPPDTQVSSTTSQSAATEVTKDKENPITTPRETIDIDLLEQEDIAIEQEDEEEDRTFETERARYSERKAARQALRLKRYKEITRTLRIQVKKLEEEVRQKQSLETKLNTVNADFRCIQLEKSEQEKELETVTAEAAAMAKKNEEICKEKEELRSEKAALLAQLKEVETKNSLVVDELSKANEKVKELTQTTENLVSQGVTVNAEKSKLKERLKRKIDTNVNLSEALEKTKENIVRVEKSLAQAVKDNELLKKDLEVSRSNVQEANNQATANNERAVEAIKKKKEYEAILSDLAEHESKTTVARLAILRRIPKRS